MKYRLILVRRQQIVVELSHRQKQRFSSPRFCFAQLCQTLRLTTHNPIKWYKGTTLLLRQCCATTERISQNYTFSKQNKTP